MRKSLLAGVAVFLVLLGILVPLLLPRPSRVTRENYERVQVGMARAEVEGILGKPGDHTTEPTVASLVPLSTAEGDEVWYGDGGIAQVCFDAGGRVTGKAFTVVARPVLSPPERLRWRLECCRDRLWGRGP